MLKVLNIKHILFSLVLFIINNKCYSQTYYRIYFTDKNFTKYNPYKYLHPKAIERRIINGIDLCDSSDFPINENYLYKVVELSDSFKGISRWMNAVFIEASDENIKLINQFDFVKKTEKVDKKLSFSHCNLKVEEDDETNDTVLSGYKLELSKTQISRLGVEEFENQMLDGKGVIICIIDVGFKGYRKNPALRHIMNRNGIKETYDFIKKQTYKNGGLSHGSSVFTCIGGKLDEYKFGLATEAEFLLARTENFMEFISEEENWLMAAEWADKLGADIINSSLGYTTHRYLPENMDGKTTFVTKAAQIASEKGILVVSSAGNEGESRWKRITAPGDAEGVLTVGAISPSTGIHAGFSSFGPSFDKRIKPEVTAFGKVVAWSRLGFNLLEGTSFSSPLVAGFAACVKQKYPLLSNKELKKLICKSSDLYPYYDYAHGFGVPSARLLLNEKTVYDSTFAITQDSSFIFISSLSTDTLIQNTNIEKKRKFKEKTPDYFFYNISDSNGYINNYYVWDAENSESPIVEIDKSKWKKPFTINVFYKNSYRQIKIIK